MVDEYKKKIVHEDGDKPYSNEYSNSHKDNIFWGVLQDDGLSTDRMGQPIYYSPHFLKRKAKEFLSVPLILEHQDDKNDYIKVGENIDVVYNNNGIIDASGNIIPADSRFWICSKLDKNELNKFNISMEDIKKHGSYSTGFSDAKYKTLGSQVNGFDFLENVKEVEDGKVEHLALLYHNSPRFNVCSRLYNDNVLEKKNNAPLELNYHNNLTSNVKNMAEENNDIKQIVTDAIKVEMAQATEEIKNVVADAVSDADDNSAAIHNEEGKKQCLQNEDTTGQVLEAIKSLNARFDVLEKKLDDLKSGNLENSDANAEPASTKEVNELQNSSNGTQIHASRVENGIFID